MAEQTKLRVLIDVVGEQQLGKLRQTLTQVESSTGKLGNTFAKARVELKRQEQATKASINSTRAFRDSFRELANSVEFGSAKFKIATREAERLDKQLAKMEKRGPGLRKRLGGAAKGVGSVAAAGVFGGPEGAIGALLGLPFGIQGAIAGGALGASVGGLRRQIAQVAELRAEFDLMRVALAGVSNDLEDFKNGMAAVTEISNQFLIPQTEVIQKYVQLKASVRGAGFDTETTTKVFKGLAAAVLSTGGSVEDTSAALRAAAQVFSKGKVTAEELRQQIGERLPGAFTQFAESIGISSQQLDKALERGEVRLDSFVVFTEDLLKIYEKNSEAIATAPEAAGRRLRVALINMGLNYGSFFTKVGSGFQDFFTKIIQFFNTNEKEIKMSFARIALALDDLLPVLKKFVQKGFDILGPFVKFTLRNAQFLANLISQLNETGKIDVNKAIDDTTANSKRLLDKYEELFGGTDPTVFGGFKDGFDTGGTSDEQVGLAPNLSARQDISFELREALIAADREQNEERKLALQFEARLLQIRESGLLQNQRAVELNKALTALEKGRNRLEEKRAKNIKDFYDSFRVKGGMFDMNVQAEQERKTPFDMLRQGADEFTDSLKGSLEAAKELATVGLQGISDGITELVVNGTLNFREFAASLLRDMARIIMQQIVMKSLMQAIGFGGGGIDPSSFMLSNPTQFNTSAVKIGSQGFGVAPLMAKGGITQGLSIAGEAGPEAVVPLPDGRSIPVTMQGGAGNVVVNVDAKGTSVQGDSTRSNALGDAIGAAVRSELLKQRRPGGLLA